MKDWNPADARLVVVRRVDTMAPWATTWISGVADAINAGVAERDVGSSDRKDTPCVPFLRFKCPHRRSGTCHSATGEPFKNKGAFTVDWKSENRHQRTTKYLDAPVSMPMISPHLWAQDGFQPVLDEQWCQTTRQDNGETDPIVVRNGTYFVTMRVHEK